MLLMSLGVFESLRWPPQRLRDSKTQSLVITGVKCITRYQISEQRLQRFPDGFNQNVVARGRWMDAVLLI
jgi:hypothetical protein